MESQHEEQDLLYLINSKKWDKAMKRLITDEGKEEMTRDNSNENDWNIPLHRACKLGAPFHLVKAMLEEYPDSVREADRDGTLPIHCACFPFDSDGDILISPQVVGLLLDAYPKGATKETDEIDYEFNFLPLHLAAMRHGPLEVLERLVDLYPEGAAILSYSDGYPLECLTDHGSPENAEDVEKAKVLFEPILRDEEFCLDFTGTLLEFRGKTPLDIATEYNILSLHTCVRIQHCHPKVIVAVARRLPEQLYMRDEDGNLPLHLAAANQNLNGAQISSLPRQSGETNEDEGGTAGGYGTDEADDDGRNIEHNEASINVDVAPNDEAEVTKDLIGELVKMHPEAAAAWNREGRFPLSLAIASGKGWHEGVEAIADAAMHVVITRDEASNLFPFMLAATVENPCLTTVYSLLRCCPELKRYVLD